MKLKWRERTEQHYSHAIIVHDLYWSNGKVLTISPCFDTSGDVPGRFYVEMGNFCGYFNTPQYWNDNCARHVKDSVMSQLEDHVKSTLAFYNELSSVLDGVNTNE